MNHTESVEAFGAHYEMIGVGRLYGSQALRASLTPGTDSIEVLYNGDQEDEDQNEKKETREFVFTGMDSVSCKYFRFG